jgi:hypothetical protein
MIGSTFYGDVSNTANTEIQALSAQNVFHKVLLPALQARNTAVEDKPGQARAIVRFPMQRSHSGACGFRSSRVRRVGLRKMRPNQTACLQ